RCPQDRCKPFRVGQVILAKFLDLPLDIVFNSPNGPFRILHNNVAGPPISIVRKTNTSAVSNRKCLQFTDEGTVNVPVDNGRTSQSAINGQQIIVRCACQWCSPKIVGAGMDDRDAVAEPLCLKSAQPNNALFTKQFASRRSDVVKEHSPQ